jgi:hypothetical protein
MKPKQQIKRKKMNRKINNKQIKLQSKIEKDKKKY